MPWKPFLQFKSQEAAGWYCSWAVRKHTDWCQEVNEHWPQIYTKRRKLLEGWLWRWAWSWCSLIILSSRCFGVLVYLQGGWYQSTQPLLRDRSELSYRWCLTCLTNVGSEPGSGTFYEVISFRGESSWLQGGPCFTIAWSITFSFSAIEESAEWLMLVREIIVSSHFIVALLKVNRVFHLSGGGGVKKRTKGYNFYTRWVKQDLSYSKVYKESILLS